MLLAAALMWALHRWLPLGHLIATPWNYFGVLPVAIGRAITVAAGVRFRQARTTFDPFKPRETSCLVTDGVFRVSRNPMYLGSVLLLIGRALEELFGETYLAYRHSVGRWIGRRE